MSSCLCVHDAKAITQVTKTNEDVFIMWVCKRVISFSIDPDLGFGTPTTEPFPFCLANLQIIKQTTMHNHKEFIHFQKHTDIAYTMSLLRGTGIEGEKVQAEEKSSVCTPRLRDTDRDKVSAGGGIEAERSAGIRIYDREGKRTAP